MNPDQEPREDDGVEDETLDPTEVPAATEEDTDAQRKRVVSIQELRERSGRTAMSETDMTVREVADALKDENDPRHAEAVEINRATAEMLRPTLDALTKSVMGSINPAASVMQRMRPPSLPKVLGSPVSEALQNAEALSERMVPETLDLVGPSVEKMLGPSQPLIDAKELTADIETANRRRREREARQDEQAELSVQTLQAMAALLEQTQAAAAATRSEMEAVKRELSEGNRSGGRLMFWTLIVAGLTLLATIGVPVVTWWLGQQG
ncbi:hypothetical protein [Micrococcus luteus]|uniref:hypothetical protein n=1 Tax=Micrococcus luteus TaxID=1270 RepID=UPI000A98EC6D|nr:hypothetical protein [Micrococcus luteus]